ncbi:PREDICTED: UV-stimulated scaffold protein A-like isoform X2 [Poecilia mexicana]|uniref:UV-stimulated scaffold protein A-like isoform X2 n=1 Tax=Poecilia mexicana TaxID=48701 RepID=UPI00072DE67A|nr:PREDICTED: UV-stimulated scaffold protein A-like isoform X2 [Poecilia mexicana]
MELSQRERLSQLVEELTTSGQPQLNQDKVKELKKICKASNDCIDHVYHSVMTQLNQEHAEIRLSAFQIASELFSRSHHFRMLLVDNFQEFLELTVETDSEQPLPPPKEVARKLRSLAIQTVQSWHTSYGSAYKKLELGYHFLKQVKKVDFQDAEARTITERRREEERQRKMERIYKARVEAATKEMEESYQDIEAALTEMESCMKLLFPEFGLVGSPAANSGPSDGQPDKYCRVDDDEPCCSKNLRERRDCREEEEDSDTENRDKSCEERKEDKEGRTKADMEEDGEGAEESSQEESDEEDSFIRNSGLISHTYSLDVSLSSILHVKETEDNEPVVSTMMELHKVISSKHLPTVQGWVQVFTKSHAEPQLLRRALSLRKSLEAVLQKHRELHIDCKTRVRRVFGQIYDQRQCSCCQMERQAVRTLPAVAC